MGWVTQTFQLSHLWILLQLRFRRRHLTPVPTSKRMIQSTFKDAQGSLCNVGSRRPCQERLVHKTLLSKVEMH